MMHDLQTYMVHEYVADYKAGYLSRRDLVRRVLNITGGLGSAATLLLALGCSAPTPAAAPTSVPAAASPAASPAVAQSLLASPAVAQSPSASPAAAPSASPSAAVKPAASPAASPSVSAIGSPSPVARSPLSVPANDPTVDAQDISFPGADGATILAYQARAKGATEPLPLVLVCHENRGLTEHIRDVTRRFTKEGFMACAVDLLSRQGGTAKVTDPNAFSALLSGPNVSPDQFVSDFASAVVYYKTRPDLVQADKIGMNGLLFRRRCGLAVDSADLGAEGGGAVLWCVSTA
jgi:carboxymethylenebutenolidase